MELAEVINGVVYSIRPSNHWDSCPYCGRVRPIPSDKRATGFVQAGFSRHLFACFEEALKKAGLKELPWDEDTDRFPVVPL